MTTAADRDAALAGQIRPILDRHLPGLVAEALVRDLAAFTSGQRAEAIEAHARTPASQRGPGRQQQQERRSA